MVDVTEVRNRVASDWARRPIRQRCSVIGKVRHQIAARSQQFIDASFSELRKHSVETIAGELIPVCDACKFIEKQGAKVLSTKKYGARHRPLWLFGVQCEVQRVPKGVVLVIGSWNYPLLLAGVQALQALAAGNAVLWKPAPGCSKASRLLIDCMIQAGVPAGCIELLPESIEETSDCIDAGVDLIILTGSHKTGSIVAQQAARRLTPCILELSGCDALVVLEDANLDDIARSITFGICFNSGATCIGPRRVFVSGEVVPALTEKLKHCLTHRAENIHVHPSAAKGVLSIIERSIQMGAVELTGAFDLEELRKSRTMHPAIFSVPDVELPVTQEDVFAPVSSLVEYRDLEDLISQINQCPYGLGLSIFGNESTARTIASRVEVGSVTINDLIGPTADARLPFGGRKQSGYGVTRGAEGLEQLTDIKTVSVRKRGFRLYLNAPSQSDAEILSGVLQFQFCRTWMERLRGLQVLMRGIRSFRSQPSGNKKGSGDS